MRIELKLRSPLPVPISASVPFIALKTDALKSKRPWGAKEKSSELAEHIAF